MGSIQVNLDDHTGNVSHQAKIDENAEVTKLIPAIISSLRFPTTDNVGRPITYYLNYRNRRLQEHETLTSAQVEEGDTLVIVPEMVPSLSDIEQIVSSLDRIKTKLGGSIDKDYAKMAISGSGSTDSIDDTCLVPEDVPLGLTLRSLFRAHKRSLTYLTWSPSGTLLASSARDGTTCLWNVQTERLLHTLVGHIKGSNSIAWSPAGELLASGSIDQSIRIWKTVNGQCRTTLVEDGDASTRKAPLRIGLDLRSITTASQLLKEPDEGIPTRIAWSPNSNLLAATAEEAIVLWDISSERPLRTLRGHSSNVNSVIWSPAGDKLASVAVDQSIIIWDARTWEQSQKLIGHVSDVNDVVWSPRGTALATCSNDYTIRIWNPENGQQLHILEGHTDMVICVSFSYDERLLASQDAAGTIFLWRTDTWQLATKPLKGSVPNGWMSGLAFHPNAPLLAVACKQVVQIWNVDIPALAYVDPLALRPDLSSIQYVSAKVVLVGNSAVGKSGLRLALTQHPYTPTDSTISCELSTFEPETIQIDETQQELRETFLWDLSGQPVYRLIHQIRLNKTVVAMIVFDGQKSDTDPFDGVHYWSRALRQAHNLQGDSALPLKTFLIAGRVDSSGIGVNKKSIERLCRELSVDHFFDTSARTGRNIEELTQAIRRSIDWNSLPKVSSPHLFKKMREFLKEQRNKGRVLLTVDHLADTFLQEQSASQMPDELYKKDLNACIDSAESQDLVHKLSFKNLVLLQPEVLDAYAFALINFVKEQPEGFGFISEKQVLNAEFTIDERWRLQNKEDEKLLLIAMVEELLQYEIALREDTDKGPFLIFPSQYTDEYPDKPYLENKTIIFRFEGPVFNVYATLVVRLSYTGWFGKARLWKDVATYRTFGGGMCSIFLENKGEGRAVLNLCFDEQASEETRFNFEKYIQSHLERRALKNSIQRERIFICPVCHEPISANVAQKILDKGGTWAKCPSCEVDGEKVTRVLLLDGEDRLKVQRPIAEVIKDMHDEADKQREQQEFAMMLQGKIATDAFDVFLCHNSIDKQQVKEIGEQLKRLGILPWLDEWEIRPGTSWQDALEQQISNIKSAAVFVGEGGLGPWQTMESKAFLSEFVNSGRPVIPVILPNLSAQVPKLPPFLRELAWIDFRKADPDPFKRLIWGITNKKTVY